MRDYLKRLLAGLAFMSLMVPSAMAGEPCDWLQLSSDAPRLEPGGAKGRALAFAVAIPLALNESHGCGCSSASKWSLPIEVAGAKSVALHAVLSALPEFVQVAFYAEGSPPKWQNVKQLPASWYTPHVSGNRATLALKWPADKQADIKLTIDAAYRGDF
ncbi:MAG: hypothetical protein OXT49_11620 [Gammaproteobacteria bacterium]|nr:hypothetical protein [Gammaproteobacteria bacterium]